MAKRKSIPGWIRTSNLRLRSEYHGQKTLCFQALLSTRYRTYGAVAQGYRAAFCAEQTFPPGSVTQNQYLIHWRPITALSLPLDSYRRTVVTHLRMDSANSKATACKKEKLIHISKGATK
jgi:hypothetical protein